MVGRSELPRAFGPYKLVRRLAAGGMAEVYVATIEGLGGFERVVALKLIHPQYSQDEEFISMLVEEAKLSVLLNHQNVVQIFDLGCIARTYFIVMEFVDGVDLHRLLKSKSDVGEALPIELTVHIVGEVCRALDYAQRCEDSMGRQLHIVHRDISPQNVLISTAGEVKLADFGIAKAAHRTGDTDVGTIKGKYYYMSPEQAWGDPVDHRSDLFSTGVLLWEMLAGQMLHKQGDVRSLLKSVRDGEVPPPSSVRAGIPSELDQIVLRATATRREDRFQTAEEFSDTLSRYRVRTRAVFSPGKLADLVEGLKVFDKGGSLFEAVDKLESMVDQIEPEDYRLSTGSVIFHLDELRNRAEDELPNLPQQTWDGDTVVESSPAVAMYETQSGKKRSRPKPALDRSTPATNETSGMKGRIGSLSIPLLSALVFAVLCAVIYFNPKTTHANLNIESLPSGASVFIDGHAVGQTPLSVPGAVEIGGNAELRVLLSGHEAWNTVVQPTSETMRYKALLSPMKFSLQVRSVPDDAEVLLDGVVVGTTPLTLDRLRGGHVMQIEARHAGKKSVTQSVTINESSTAKPLVFQLE